MYVSVCVCVDRDRDRHPLNDISDSLSSHLLTSADRIFIFLLMCLFSRGTTAPFRISGVGETVGRQMDLLPPGSVGTVKRGEAAEVPDGSHR